MLCGNVKGAIDVPLITVRKYLKYNKLKKKNLANILKLLDISWVDWIYYRIHFWYLNAPINNF